MARHPALILLLVGLLSSGCASRAPLHPGGPGGAQELLPYYVADEFPIDWDHSDADHHDMRLHDAAYNLDFQAYHACTPAGAWTPEAPGGFAGAAFDGSFLYVANNRGLCVLDVRDPTAPRFVSQYAGPAGSDVELSADGHYAFLGTQRQALPAAGTLPSTQPDQLPRGVHVINVQDPARPRFESYYPVPTNGVHTLSTYLQGPTQLVFIQTYDWVPPGELNSTVQPPPAPQNNAPVTPRVEITRLTRDPTGAAFLERVGEFEFPRPPTQPLVHYFPHDSHAQKHPMTGQDLLFVAYWNAGLVILDITNPVIPRQIAQYADPSPSRYNQYHDVHASEELIDGRHITVTGPEVEQGPETGVLRVFDTTDPTRPAQLGTWRLPGDLGIPKEFRFSPHEFSVHGGRIYLGSNHAGVWVIDISDAEHLRNPASWGYYFPHGDARLEPSKWSTSSSTWGAYYHDGSFYATESASGVHVLQFRGDRTPHPPV